MRETRSKRQYLPVADHSTSRVMNQKVLVDTIFKRDGISKATLARELGLSKPAVAKNVADLVSMGLVTEVGEGKAGKNGGRKPVRLSFNGSYRYIGALDLAFQSPVCAIGNMRCNLLGIRKLEISREAPGEAKRACVVEAFLEMMEQLDIDASGLGVVVISQPGIIGDDGESTYICKAKKLHLAWTSIGLKHYLQQELGVPVIVKNDVNLAAMGELYFGAGRQFQSLIYVSGGVGLGAGIVIGGRLYEGHSRAAGELGDLIREDGRRVEQFLTIDSLLERVRTAIGGEAVPSFAQVVDMANSGDAAVLCAIRELGRELGYIIYNCGIMFDIPNIIFGGDFLKLGSALFEGMEAVQGARHRILPSGLTESASIFGGFALGKDEVLHRKIRDG